MKKVLMILAVFVLFAWTVNAVAEQPHNRPQNPSQNNGAYNHNKPYEHHDYSRQRYVYPPVYVPYNYYYNNVPAPYYTPAPYYAPAPYYTPDPYYVAPPRRWWFYFGF